MASDPSFFCCSFVLSSRGIRTQIPSPRPGTATTTAHNRPTITIPQHNNEPRGGIRSRRHRQMARRRRPTSSCSKVRKTPHGWCDDWRVVIDDNTLYSCLC